MPAGPGPRAGLRTDLDETLGLQHLDRLTDHRATDAELDGEVVLVGQRRSGRPLTTDDPPADSSTTRPCNPRRG